MSWPFEDTFTTAPAAGWLVASNALTFSHNAGLGSIDISCGDNYGCLRINEPQQSRFNFIADIEVLTSTRTGAGGNWAGLWVVSSNTTATYGYNFMNYKYDATNNSWTFTRTNPNGRVAVPRSPAVYYPQSSPVDPVPVFALNKIMRHQIEVTSVNVGGRWIDNFVYTVDGVKIVTFSDWDRVDSNTGLYTPGIFLYGCTARVHYVSGNTDQNSAAWTPGANFIVPEINTSFGDSSTLNSGYPAEPMTKFAYKDRPLINVGGRILDDSFKPATRSLQLRRADTGEYVASATSNDDGEYQFKSVEEGYEYVTEYYDANGLIARKPKADYVGHGELAGRYTIRGENTANCEVRVFSEVTGEYLGHTTTDTNGQFRVPNVNPDHLFTLVFREATGAWEDRVSSRRIPEPPHSP